VLVLLLAPGSGRWTGGRCGFCGQEPPNNRFLPPVDVALLLDAANAAGLHERRDAGEETVEEGE
jgi:hypothetical protein